MARRKQEYVDRFLQEDGSTLELDAKMVKRNWFLTVNKNAECYDNLLDIVEFLNERSERFYHYAVILHDRDTISEKGYNKLLEEAYSKDSWGLFDSISRYQVLPDDKKTSVEYAYKPEHYHVLMCFQDAKTWSFIKRHFPGAHVQTCISVANCFHYLTHDTQKARELGKTPYDKSNIKMDKTGQVFFDAKPVEEMQFRYFNPHHIAKYVFIDGLHNYCDFTLEFSAVQCQRWLSSIQSMCNLYERLSMAMQNHTTGEYCGDRKFCYTDDMGVLHFVSDKEINDLVRSNASSVKLAQVFDIKRYIQSLILTPFGEQVYKLHCMMNDEFSSLEKFLLWKCLPNVAEYYEIEKCELQAVCDSDSGIFEDDAPYTLRVVNN